jgi:hypothetical protein
VSHLGIRTFLIALYGVLCAGLVQAKSKRPEFSDYAAAKIYNGRPAKPKLTREQRTFRTRIRLAAKQPVDFAGHYVVAAWGCGASCVAFSIVDSVSGVVYDGFGVAELPGSWEEEHPAPERLEYKRDSRLLRINGCPNETNCGFYDYEMVEGQGLMLLRKELLPKKYQ